GLRLLDLSIRRRYAGAVVRWGTAARALRTNHPRDIVVAVATATLDEGHGDVSPATPAPEPATSAVRAWQGGADRADRRRGTAVRRERVRVHRMGRARLPRRRRGPRGSQGCG